MSARSLVWYLLSLLCLIVAVFFLVKSLDWKAYVALVLGVGAVLLFWQGTKVSKKK
ncbi:MAG: hypothetical protein NT092_10635 [Bacteroidia bacterium]|nr:hypothetical protein [Bacteroidia bacterium]